MTMHISIASQTDVPALNTLINSAYRGESSKKGWTTEADLLDGLRTSEVSLSALLAKPGAIVLTSRDDAGRITGCVYLQKEPDTFYLGMLTVSPVLQAGGIGRKLLQAAEHYVKTAEGRHISMTVISLRHELIAWYERQGYARTGATKPFPADPAFGIPRQPLEFVVLQKTLDTDASASTVQP